MATIKINLDKRRVKQNGTYPLKLNISLDKNLHTSVNLGISLLENQWNGSEVIKHDSKIILNQTIRKWHNDVQLEILKLTVSGELLNMPMTKLKRHIDKILTLKNQEDEVYLVKTHFEYFLSFKTKIKTIESYSYTLRKIAAFEDVNTFSFSCITPSWLKQFEKFLSETLSINSVAIHMRNLRSVFNDAINTDKVSQALYPFRKFKIKSEKTIKRSLTIDELRKFRDYECEPHQQKYKDLFMLIFYMEGINIIDLLNLKSLNNGRAEFKRSKTGRLYCIKIEEEAQLIINKYKGINYLLDILDTYSNYRDFAHRMNLNLQKIGEVKLTNRCNNRIGKKEISPIFPNITTYWARHTWATIAAGLDIPKETIAAALGHGGNTVTDIYISFDMKKVDEANRKVLDAIK